jgi:hypothetical protein
MMEEILSCIGVLALGVFVACSFILLGWDVCKDDVEARLTGKKPVDDYWRKRGMR